MGDALDFDRYETAIGRLILACSRVEYELFRAYQEWLPSRSYFNDRYASRFDRVIESAQERVARPESLVEMLVGMRDLAAIRHLVAHNPIHHVATEDRHRFQTPMDFAVLDNKGGEQALSLEELEAFADKARSLSIRLAVSLRTQV